MHLCNTRLTRVSYQYHIYIALQWHNNERDGISNHQPHECLLNRLFRNIKENIKAPRHWPLCGELIGDQWIPCTKGQQHRKCFHLMTPSWKTQSDHNANFVHEKCQWQSSQHGIWGSSAYVPLYDDAIVWKHFLHYGALFEGNPRVMVDSPPNGKVMQSLDIFILLD